MQRCGDGICEGSESCGNCLIDCTLNSTEICDNGIQESVIIETTSEAFDEYMKSFEVEAKVNGRCKTEFGEKVM
ncbi:MAG: hypothetical protein ABEJ72_06185, partial [Candidatus Aenigmatarchaeota archaeon]